MSMTEALAEAYASQPVDERVIDTLELIHPAFLDDFGNPTGIRVVAAYEKPGILLTLEDSAPLNPGEQVEFKSLNFNLTHPGFAENDIPSLQFSISNVNRLVTKYLEMAIQQTTPITAIYRPYLESDPSAPQLDPVITMELTNVKSELVIISATATLGDVFNWPFPALKYLPEVFRGLVR